MEDHHAKDGVPETTMRVVYSSLMEKARITDESIETCPW